MFGAFIHYKNTWVIIDPDSSGSYWIPISWSAEWARMWLKKPIHTQILRQLWLISGSFWHRFRFVPSEKWFRSHETKVRVSFGTGGFESTLHDKSPFFTFHVQNLLWLYVILAWQNTDFFQNRTFYSTKWRTGYLNGIIQWSGYCKFSLYNLS